MAIELRHLRYVVAVADGGSFRKAAALLGIRESAVSRRVRDLEDHIGVSLFVRDHAGVRLTYAGEQFIWHARSAIACITQAVAEVGTIGRGETGAVRIGLYVPLSSGFLAALVQAFESEHPDVRIVLHEGSFADATPAVRQLRVDVAFVSRIDAPDDCEIIELGNERLLVAMARDHSLAARDELLWQDLAGQRIILCASYRTVDGWDKQFAQRLAQADSAIVDRQYISRDTVLQLVANGRRLTLVGEGSAMLQTPSVTYRPIAGETVAIAALWSPRNDNPAFRRFLARAKQYAAEAKRNGRTPYRTNGLGAYPADSVALSQNPDLLP
jgi:DNA-binding transcriptional LysR family regulator